MSGARPAGPPKAAGMAETTPLLRANAYPFAWPRSRKLGWLFSKADRYPAPALPSQLCGLQNDLDQAWVEMEVQYVAANRYNLLCTFLSLIVITSGALITGFAQSRSANGVSTVLGAVTTAAGSILAALRATGQPSRAWSRYHQLDRVIDHVARLYYQYGGPGYDPEQVRRAVRDAWKMVDEFEAEAEERDGKSAPFGSAVVGAPLVARSTVAAQTAEADLESGSGRRVIAGV